MQHGSKCTTNVNSTQGRVHSIDVQKASLQGRLCMLHVNIFYVCSGYLVVYELNLLAATLCPAAYTRLYHRHYFTEFFFPSSSCLWIIDGTHEV